MDLKQRVIAITIAIATFIIIIELVRRKKLSEEFSVIWLLAGIIIILFAVWSDLLLFITRVTGIIAPTSIVFFFGIISLILINLQFSIKISKLQNQLKNLAQKQALMSLDKEQPQKILKND